MSSATPDDAERPHGSSPNDQASCRGHLAPDPNPETEAMHGFDPSRAAFLLLDFQNYGIHPDGYWAKHGEPDWPAIARPALENAARVLAAARQSGLLLAHVGVAWRDGSPEMNLSASLFARAPDWSVEGTWGAEPANRSGRLGARSSLTSAA
jgi:hypothetical protein